MDAVVARAGYGEDDVVPELSVDGWVDPDFL
jgi:hypothetical protein